jgi:hypothetical protein
LSAKRIILPIGPLVGSKVGKKAQFGPVFSLIYCSSKPSWVLVPLPSMPSNTTKLSSMSI